MPDTPKKRGPGRPKGSGNKEPVVEVLTRLRMRQLFDGSSPRTPGERRFADLVKKLPPQERIRQRVGLERKERAVGEAAVPSVRFEITKQAGPATCPSCGADLRVGQGDPPAVQAALPAAEDEVVRARAATYPVPAPTVVDPTEAEQRRLRKELAERLREQRQRMVEDRKIEEWRKPL